VQTLIYVEVFYRQVGHSHGSCDLVPSGASTRVTTAASTAIDAFACSGYDFLPSYFLGTVSTTTSQYRYPLCLIQNVHMLLLFSI